MVLVEIWNNSVRRNYRNFRIECKTEINLRLGIRLCNFISNLTFIPFSLCRFLFSLSLLLWEIFFPFIFICILIVSYFYFQFCFCKLLFSFSLTYRVLVLLSFWQIFSHLIFIITLIDFYFHFHFRFDGFSFSLSVSLW